jgi:hypothetical protein
MSLDNVSPPAPSTQDALQLLRSDHQRIEALLSDCLHLAVEERGRAPSADRNGCLERLAATLQVHAQIERELFYPLLKVDALERDSAQLDHDEILVRLKTLLAHAPPQDDFERQLEVLAQLIRKHIALEELQLFRRLDSSDLDELGAQLAIRRGDLLGEQGAD